MKQHTTPEQTAKLIELGLLPKRIQSVSDDGKMLLKLIGFSIGELIEMLPNVVESKDSEYATLQMYFDLFNWIIEYTGVEKTEHATSAIEFIDALYDMVIKLKEEKIL